MFNYVIKQPIKITHGLKIRICYTIAYDNLNLYWSRSIWKLVTWFTRMNNHEPAFNDITCAHLSKVTRTGQVQDVHVLVDVLAIETSENEYPAISQKRYMISPR